MYKFSDTAAVPLFSVMGLTDVMTEIVGRVLLSMEVSALNRGYESPSLFYYLVMSAMATVIDRAIHSLFSVWLLVGVLMYQLHGLTSAIRTYQARGLLRQPLLLPLYRLVGADDEYEHDE